MLKKMTVLAMAVGVVAAMALPASAAAQWKHHSTAIQTNTTIGVTGNARFQGGLGGVECQVTSRVKFVPGTTGVAETFVPDPTDATTNCKGLGGLSPCQIHNLTPQTEANWPVHTNTSVMTVQVNQSITSQATGGIFCLVKHIELTQGSVTFTPNQPSTVSSAQLQGSLPVDIQTNNGTKHQENVTVSGSLSVESPNAATYSI